MMKTKVDYILVVIGAGFLVCLYIFLTSMYGCQNSLYQNGFLAELKQSGVIYDCRVPEGIPNNLTAEQAVEYVDQCIWWNNMTDPCSLKYGPNACTWKR